MDVGGKVCLSHTKPTLDPLKMDPPTAKQCIRLHRLASSASSSVGAPTQQNCAGGEPEVQITYNTSIVVRVQSEHIPYTMALHSLAPVDPLPCLW